MDITYQFPESQQVFCASFANQSDLDAWLAENPCAQDVGRIMLPLVQPNALHRLIAVYRTSEAALRATNLALIKSIHDRDQYTKHFRTRNGSRAERDIALRAAYAVIEKKPTPPPVALSRAELAAKTEKEAARATLQKLFDLRERAFGPPVEFPKEERRAWFRITEAECLAKLAETEPDSAI